MKNYFFPRNKIYLNPFLLQGLPQLGNSQMRKVHRLLAKMFSERKTSTEYLLFLFTGDIG